MPSFSAGYWRRPPSMISALRAALPAPPFFCGSAAAAAPGRRGADPACRLSSESRTERLPRIGNTRSSVFVRHFSTLRLFYHNLLYISTNTNSVDGTFPFGYNYGMKSLSKFAVIFPFICLLALAAVIISNGVPFGGHRPCRRRGFRHRLSRKRLLPHRGRHPRRRK